MTHDLTLLAEVVAFLVAIMVLARACAAADLFTAWGGVVARAATGSRSARTALVVALAAVVTATLTLDATVVLLTPVLLAGGAVGLRTAAYASVRIANSGSTLLPISNLTNLLAFGTTGLTFGRFAWLMLPVWLVALVAEWLVLRYWFRDDPDPLPPAAPPPAVPWLATTVVALVLVGVATTPWPWVPTAAGALALGVVELVRRRVRVRDLVTAAGLPMAAVVMLWGALVLWFGRTEVGGRVADLVPSGDGWLAVVGTALVAMLVAAVVNNLPATLLLAPAAAAVGGPVGVLAVLVGVTVGANLVVTSSLANVLWWRSGGSTVTSWRAFHRLGLLTTPPLVVLCASVLWAWSSLV